jgi:hypothetical protein
MFVAPGFLIDYTLLRRMCSTLSRRQSDHGFRQKFCRQLNGSADRRPDGRTISRLPRLEFLDAVTS